MLIHTKTPLSGRKANNFLKGEGICRGQEVATTWQNINILRNVEAKLVKNNSSFIP